MDHAEAQRLAGEWLADRNHHDLERILGHDADAGTLRSPVAQRVGVPGGAVTGRPALAAYSGAGIAAAPGLGLHTQVVLAGVAGLTVVYRDHRHQRCAATVLFDDDGRVVSAHVQCAPAARP